MRQAMGYCWPQSVEPGGSVGLHVSSPGGQPVDVTATRIGGTITEVWSAHVDADEQGIPPDVAARGCDWPSSVTIEVGDDWASGYYEVVIAGELRGKRRESHAFFVVRPVVGAPTGRALLALSTNTWHAYNDWGGPNLYTGGVEVSMQRPMERGFLHKPPGAGRRVTTMQVPDVQMAAHVGYLRLNHLSPWAGSAGWPDWEQPFLEWAEADGYAIDVCTNADLEEHPELLDQYPLYLSVGHDEYWSGPMRDTVEAHIARGGNAAFLSGNTAFWQVRLEGESDAGPATTVVGYKARLRSDPVFDTERQPELTTIWSDHLLERPENHMTGVSFVRGGYHRIGPRVTRGAGGYTVYRSDHWLFADTDIGYGDVLGADATIVGYECDGCDFTMRDGRPEPTGVDGTPSTFEILAMAPAAHFTRTAAPRPPKPDEPSEIEFIASRAFGSRDPEHVRRIEAGHAILGAYTNDAGATAVTSGSTDWAHGLAARDPHVEQITRNLLDRLGASS
ncbi:MAG: N,N-dimethylformamidase beta subunit family domain-containing protein [Actinomycetota bacterium]